MEAARARRRLSGAGSVAETTTSDRRAFPLAYPLVLRLSAAPLWFLARPAAPAPPGRQQAALARRAVSRPPAAEAARVEALPAAALGRGAASPLPAVVAPRVVVPPAALAQEAAWRRPARAAGAARAATQPAQALAQAGAVTPAEEAEVPWATAWEAAPAARAPAEVAPVPR